MLRVHVNSISEYQLRRLENGHPIQLTYSQIADQSHDPKHLMLHPIQHKKVVNAHKKKRGVRIQLTPSEVESSSSGLKSMWSYLKNKVAPAVVKGAKWVKQNVIDTPFYQENVRPVLHTAVSDLEGMLPQNAVTNIVKKGVDQLGESTQGFGIKKVPKPRAKKGSKGLYAGSGLWIGGEGLYAGKVKGPPKPKKLSRGVKGLKTGTYADADIA